MKTVLGILLPLVIVALGALGAVTLVGLRPEAKPSDTETLPPLVDAIEAVSAEVELFVETQGTVRPRTESRLVSEVAGRAIEVSGAWVDGGFFAEDEVLLRLDPTDYLLAEREAASRVAQGELRLALEEADAELARRDWKTERGAEEPPPLVAREPQLAEARAVLAAARGAHQKALRDVERCTIVAPFPGRVQQATVDRGEFVSRGAELGRIYAVDQAEVRLPLPDAELAYLDLPLSYRGDPEGMLGPEVTLHARFAGKDHTWVGRIVRTEGELDPTSRMVVAVARVDDPYGRGEVQDRPPLSAGMFVEARIRGVTVPDAIALPRSALRTGNRVFVIDRKDRLQIREVDLLRSERDRVLVRGGIEPGARVVVSPLEEAVDGMQVRESESEDSQP